MEYYDRLKGMDVSKWIDIVQNYKRYGYPESAKEAALSLLKEEGITLDDLKSKGLLENKSIDQAKDLYQRFRRNSWIVMVIFVVNVTMRFTMPDDAPILLVILFWALVAAYLILLSLALDTRGKFYHHIGKTTSGSEQIYLFFGIAFYMVFYYFLSKEMREDLAEYSPPFQGE